MAIRRFLTAIFLKLMPDSSRLRYLAQRPALATWAAKHPGSQRIFADRFQLYDFINSETLHNDSMQYLEFGVFQGESIRYFSELNTNPKSRFIGFDTFEGLPEDWVELTRTVKSQTFSVDGKIPQIDDARVCFEKGLFQETLPDALQGIERNKQLVIHNDSDLYSSTLYVLTYANQIISPGTIIIFDEFYSVMDEFRALEDYCSAYMRSYEVLGVTPHNVQVAIRME